MTIAYPLLTIPPRRVSDLEQAVRRTLAAAKARARRRHGPGLALVRPLRAPGDVPMVELRRGSAVVVRCARPVGRAGALDALGWLAMEAREWWALGSHREGCRGCGSAEVAPMRLCVRCEQQEAAEEVVLQGELWGD